MRLDSRLEVGALAGRLPGDVLFEGGVQGADGRGRGQGVAAEGRGVQVGVGEHRREDLLGDHDVAAGDDRSAEGLAHGHDVGRDVPVVDAPELAGAAHAGLHLVGDEDDVPGGADLAHPRQVVVGRHDGAGLALHRFADEGRDVEADHVADLELLLQGVGVAVGHEPGTGHERLEGHAELALAAYAQAAHRLAVEGPRGGDDAQHVVGLLLVGVDLGELERALGGFGARVDEERVLQIAGGDHGNELAEVAAHGVEQLLGVQRLMAQLAEHGPHDGRMAVAEHVDAEAAQAVDELAAADVLEGGAAVAPLDGRVVGRDRLAVVEDAGVDVAREVLDAVGDDRVLLGGRELVLLHEVERLARFVQDALAQQIVHRLSPSHACLTSAGLEHCGCESEGTSHSPARVTREWVAL